MTWPIGFCPFSRSKEADRPISPWFQKKKHVQGQCLRKAPINQKLEHNMSQRKHDILELLECPTIFAEITGDFKCFQIFVVVPFLL